MAKKIIGGILLLLCLVASGCPLVGLMSDRAVYVFKGTTRSLPHHEIIPGVSVSASCKETRLDPPLDTMSDEHGFFSLHGLFVGQLDDCELSFKHPQFKPRVIKLTRARDFTAEGLGLIWNLNVELEPN